MEEGQGIGLVIRTGDQTYIGVIANTVSSTKPKPTPLKKEVSRFIKIITVVALAIGVIFLGVGFGVKLPWIANVVFVIGIVVANVPEGLLPTLTVALTLTAKRLKEQKVLAKNLEAVETLGACSTICSDKTGTLTQNIMTVVHLWFDGKIQPALEESESESFTLLTMVGALCNNSSFNPDDANMALPIQARTAAGGDASETAILKFCSKIFDVEEFRSTYPKRFEIPFNSEIKYQLSIHQFDDTKDVLVMKGAPERVLARCTTIIQEGQPVPMKKQHRTAFERAYTTMAGDGERVLAMAYRELPHETFPPSVTYSRRDNNVPASDLCFLGLIALQDPPKAGVKEAVLDCAAASIRIIMVTGDHALTATAIAREIGIVRDRTLNDVAVDLGVDSWRDVDPDEVFTPDR